jgi:tetratricopeptide (TPR) repeat protein
MSILLARNDLSGAKEQYLIANSIPSIDYIESLDINMAAIHVMEGKNEEAERLYEQVIRKTRGKSSVAYGAYISYLQGRYAVAVKNEDGSAAVFGARLLEHMEKLYRLNKDPMLLYKAGQLSLALDRCDDAFRFFIEAGKCMPQKSDYARFANKLAVSCKKCL